MIVRVPASYRKPHMITYNQGTHFRIRVDEGKREMSLPEIRAAVLDGPTERRMSAMEQSIVELLRTVKKQTLEEGLLAARKSGITPIITNIEDGHTVADYTRQSFEQTVGTQPFFWIAATPVVSKRGGVSVDDNALRAALQAPPDSREDGWNMANRYVQPERSADGLVRGSHESRYLKLLDNGHMEFWTPLDEHFCWMQTDEERMKAPRLYPWPVTEFPTTFLRLYKRILETTSIQSDIIVQMEYRNLRGFNLRPYRPDIVGYSDPSNAKRYDQDHYYDSRQVGHDFNPDELSFQLLERFYADFGYESRKIPFYKMGEGFRF